MGMKATATKELDMQAEKVPWPKTQKELMEYIDSLVDREHDYGTCVYEYGGRGYVGEVGGDRVPGQLCRLRLPPTHRGMDGPFILLKADDLCFPQYDLRQKLEEFIQETRPWVREECQRKLKEKVDPHPNVLKHWQEMAK